MRWNTFCTALPGGVLSLRLRNDEPHLRLAQGKANTTMTISKECLRLGSRTSKATRCGAPASRFSLFVPRFSVNCKARNQKRETNQNISVQNPLDRPMPICPCPPIMFLW
jgi:hypothetical protein